MKNGAKASDVNPMDPEDDLGTPVKTSTADLDKVTTKRSGLKAAAGGIAEEDVAPVRLTGPGARTARVPEQPKWDEKITGRAKRQF